MKTCTCQVKGIPGFGPHLSGCPLGSPEPPREQDLIYECCGNLITRDHADGCKAGSSVPPDGTRMSESRRAWLEKYGDGDHRDLAAALAAVGQQRNEAIDALNLTGVDLDDLRERVNQLEKALREKDRLIGYAIFNLGKGKTAAVETLLNKALSATQRDSDWCSCGKELAHQCGCERSAVTDRTGEDASDD